MWLFKKKKYESDEELAFAYFQSGDKELIGDLFEKHVKTVFGVCLFYFRDKDQAKDAVMQIFEKLINELKKTEVKNFKGWLSFVVRNYCISEIRKSKSKQFVSETYLEFEIKEPSLEEEERMESVNEELMLEYMKDCLDNLKPNQKICVELFYLNNLSYQQISDQIRLSLNEVKSQIQNGKRNLKLLIEQKLKNENNAA
jgi:RNA polymerase sigma-70 factor (ECF subfamily)